MKSKKVNLRLVLEITLKDIVKKYRTITKYSVVHNEDQKYLICFRLFLKFILDIAGNLKTSIWSDSPI